MIQTHLRKKYTHTQTQTRHRSHHSLARHSTKSKCNILFRCMKSTHVNKQFYRICFDAITHRHRKTSCTHTNTGTYGDRSCLMMLLRTFAKERNSFNHWTQTAMWLFWTLVNLQRFPIKFAWLRFENPHDFIQTDIKSILTPIAHRHTRARNTLFIRTKPTDIYLHKMWTPFCRSLQILGRFVHSMGCCFALATFFCAEKCFLLS